MVVRTKELIDCPQTLVQVGGNRRLLRELAGLFPTEYQRLWADLQSALERKDAAGVKREAHTLKGSLRMFAAPSALAAARRLERMGHEVHLDGAGTLADTRKRKLPKCSRLSPPSQASDRNQLTILSMGHAEQRR